jgi:protein tyrosine/serine phosphatase
VADKKKQSPVALFVILLAVVAAILLVRHFHIKNFRVIKPEALYTSGQPRGMDYTRLLYKYHIGTIVNVRSAAEHREKNWHNEEVTWVRDNGVKYFELPIEKANHLPDKQTQEQFLAIMADKVNLPVLLHDSNGRKRVSMLAAVWAIKAEKYSAADAIELVQNIKEQPLTEAEKNFIKSLAR